MKPLIETEPDAWPEELQPKELMFFSIDVVGSTAIKQTRVPTEEGVIPDNSEWFRDIQTFYIRSVATFFEACKRKKENDKNLFAQNMKEPRLWKTRGDEVLFWVEITDTRQVVLFIEAWKSSVEDLKKGLEDRKLDFKATAWISHFPWRNKMIFTSSIGSTDSNMDGAEDKNLQLAQTYFRAIYSTDRSKATHLMPDFVGPGMDIGFRLSDQATQRRFVISTDVAYMLAMGATHMKRSIDDLKIHFEGLQILKGVLGGLEYPLFWIDMSDENDIYSYSHDLGRRGSCTRSQIIEFMDQFYHQRYNYLYKPFIVSTTEQVLKGAPEWYVNAHRSLLEREKITGPAAEAEAELTAG